MSRKYDFHDGQRGSALAIRVTPRASRNQIVGLLNDGTVKVHLATDPAENRENAELLSFLADVLGVPRSRVEVVAGENGRQAGIGFGYGRGNRASACPCSHGLISHL